MNVSTLIFLLRNILGYFLFLELSHLSFSMPWNCLSFLFCLFVRLFLKSLLHFWPFLLSPHSLTIFYLSTECLSSSRVSLGPCPFLYIIFINNLTIVMPTLCIYSSDFSFEIQAHVSSILCDIYSWMSQGYIKINIFREKLMIFPQSQFISSVLHFSNSPKCVWTENLGANLNTLFTLSYWISLHKNLWNHLSLFYHHHLLWAIRFSSQDYRNGSILSSPDFDFSNPSCELQLKSTL